MSNKRQLTLVESLVAGGVRDPPAAMGMAMSRHDVICTIMRLTDRRGFLAQRLLSKRWLAVSQSDAALLGNTGLRKGIACPGATTMDAARASARVFGRALARFYFCVPHWHPSLMAPGRYRTDAEGLARGLSGDELRELTSLCPHATGLEYADYARCGCAFDDQMVLAVAETMGSSLTSFEAHVFSSHGCLHHFPKLLSLKLGFARDHVTRTWNHERASYLYMAPPILDDVLTSCPSLRELELRRVPLGIRELKPSQPHPALESLVLIRCDVENPVAVVNLKLLAGTLKALVFDECEVRPALRDGSMRRLVADELLGLHSLCIWRTRMRGKAATEARSLMQLVDVRRGEAATVSGSR